MNFPTILVIILFGEKVWVRGTYYVEVKDWATSASNTIAPVMTTFLYECQANPQGTSAYKGLASICTLVTSYEKKTEIHATCSFYTVFMPNLRGHEIQLLDRPNAELEYEEWNLGLTGQGMDHPNFGVPRANDLAHFSARIQAIGEPIVQPDEVNTLKFYYAQANVIAYFFHPHIPNTHLTLFSTVLERIINQYGRIDQIRNEVRAENLRNKVNAAMKMALIRMLDPCTFLQGDFQVSAPPQCVTFCRFLNIAALNFGPTSNRCSSLIGGHCELGKCLCTRMASPLSGCQSSPMRMCTNALRVILNI